MKNVMKSLHKLLFLVCELFKYFTLIFLMLIICLFLIWYATYWFKPEWNGSHSLGKNLYVLEWDGGNIMVFGTNIIGKTCTSGINIIPDYQDNECNNRYSELSQWNDSLGLLSEFIEDYKNDSHWIIAKTYNKVTHKKRYYIIDKNYDEKKIEFDDVIRRFKYSFTDSCMFSKECKLKRIQLTF